MWLSLLSRLASATQGPAQLFAAGAALVFLSAPSMPIPADTGAIGAKAAAGEIRALKAQLDGFTVQGKALIDSDGLSAQTRNAAIPLVAVRDMRMTPFAGLSSRMSAYPTALDCLTEAIYYEAANESAEGKRAVAQVILNRVAHPAYPASICGVVYQGWSDEVCQFSYTCDGALARRPIAGLWRQSRAVAGAALGGHVEQSVGSATHYHADYVLPYWAYRLVKVHVAGRHIFYRLPGRAGNPGNFTAAYTGREYKPAFNPARFAHSDSDPLEEAAGLTIEPHFPRDITDRRADNDIGGRIDTSKEWRLSIPDPTTASTGYQATLAGQRTSREGEP